MLAVCSTVEEAKGSIVPLDSLRGSIQDRFQALSSEGFRTLGVAYRTMDSAETIAKAAETDMVFLGFLVLRRPTEGRHRPDGSAALFAGRRVEDGHG